MPQRCEGAILIAVSTFLVVATTLIGILLIRENGILFRPPPTPARDRSNYVIAPETKPRIQKRLAHASEVSGATIDRVGIESGTIHVFFSPLSDDNLQIGPLGSGSQAAIPSDGIGFRWTGAETPRQVKLFAQTLAAQSGWETLWARPTRAMPLPLLNYVLATVFSDRLRIPVGTFPLMLLLVEATSVWLLFRWRHPLGAGSAPLPRADDAQSHSALILILGVTTGLVVLATICKLRFWMDDFPHLVRAVLAPSEIDGDVRLLTAMVNFQIGVQLAHDRIWFGVVNLTCLLIACASWGALVRRLGLSRDASILAGILFALTPGTLYLLRFASGAEHLAASACLLTVLLLIDIAARDDQHALPWRYGVLGLALCLNVLGILMKYPVFVTFPLVCWLWGKWFVANPSRPMDRHVFYALFAIATVLPFLLIPRANQVPLGFHPSPVAWLSYLTRIGAYLMACGITTLLAPSPRKSFRRLTEILLAPAGRVPLVGWATIMSFAWTIPFLLNAGYEGRAYYARMMSAPAAALCAAALCSAASASSAARLRQLRSAIACVLVVAVLLPYREIKAELIDPLDGKVWQWMEQVHLLTARQTAPAAVRVTANCPSGRQQSSRMILQNELWWATGWYGLPIEFPTATESGESGQHQALGEPIAILQYCPPDPPHLDWR